MFFVQMTGDIMKISFFETSAKDAVNVEAVFRAVGAKILESEWILSQDDNTWQQNSICLHEDPGFENLELLFGSNRFDIRPDDDDTGDSQSPQGNRRASGNSKDSENKCFGKCVL